MPFSCLPSWSAPRSLRLAPQLQTLMLKHVPDDAVFAALAMPRSVLTHESMEMLPTEVLTAVGEKEFGIDPLDIEAALIVVAPPVAGPPEIGVVLKMNDESATLKDGADATVCGAENGIIVAASGNAMGEKLISSVEGDLCALARSMNSANMDLTAALDVEKIRPMAMGIVANTPPLPPPFEPLKQAPELVQRIDLRVRATRNQIAEIRFVGNNEADAERLEELVGDAMDAGRAMLMQQLQDQLKSDDAIEVASSQYASRIMNKVFEDLRPSRNGESLAFAAEGAEANQAAVIGVLVALLLPAVQAAREAARRAQAINQVKQVSLAMINYESAMGSYPARASFDDEGKPLLSWRVHVLPYLEEVALYKQFHLDEPWDSEHNRKLIAKMPAIYAHPDLEPGKTHFLVPVGPGTVFEGDKGRLVREITDGTSKTLMVVEADDNAAVVWTKPDDLTYDPNNPVQNLGNLRAGGFIASRCDCSVGFFARTVDPQVLAALFSRAGSD